MKRKTMQGPVLSANVTGLLPKKMQATVPIVNGEGLMNGAVPQPKILVTGWGKRIQLCPLNLATMYNGGLVVVSCGEYLSAGDIRTVEIGGWGITITIGKRASRDSGTKYLPTTHFDDVSVFLDVKKFNFAHVGVGKEEDESGFYAQSLHQPGVGDNDDSSIFAQLPYIASRQKQVSVTLLPPGVSSMDEQMEMYDYVTLGTVLPPPQIRSSWLMEKYRKYPTSFPALHAA